MLKPQTHQRFTLNTLKGFRDFLPEQAIARQYVIDKIKAVFERFGYDPIETPTLEYAEVLQGKYGVEGDKLLYTFKDRGGRNVGLRYDQTVPTSRLIGSHPELPRPFKRYQIQNVWRQENPQKGRFREFLQCDADIFAPSITPFMDAEPIAIAYYILQDLGFRSFRLLINSRTSLFALMDKAGVPHEQWIPIITTLDKLEKIGKEKVSLEIHNKIGHILHPEKIFEELSIVVPDEYINQIIDALLALGIPKEAIQFSPALARGLDYYTGVIYEGIITGYDVGSVLGGGRYDKLVGTFFGEDLPATGFSLGFDRILDALGQFVLLPKKNTVSRILVTIFAPELVKQSLEIAMTLRGHQINTEVYLDPQAKMDKQLKYADRKGIPYVIIVGPEEIDNHMVTLKNMQTQDQKNLSVEEAIKIIS